MINFTSKLNIDKSFYEKLNQNNKDRIIETIRPVVEHPVYSELTGCDVVTISAKKKPRLNCITINFQDLESDIFIKDEIQPMTVLNQIFLYACIKNNRRTRSKYSEVAKCFVQLVKEKMNI